MLRFILLILFSTFTFGHRNFGIKGGFDVEDGLFPYEVSVQGCDWFGCEHNCGGSIIDRKWILTAGHCFIYGFTMQVIAGTVKLSIKDNYTQIIKVKKFHINEHYRGNANPNDIALIELEEPLTYNDRVKPIALPAQGFETTGPANTSGWGYVKESIFPKRPDIMQWIEMTILPGDECLAAIAKSLDRARNPFEIDSNVCAVNMTAAICHGDSGSPLAQNGKLIGLTSWAVSPCNIDKVPPAFTKVSSYIDWIYNITGELD